MKKIIALFAVALALGSTPSANAQEKIKEAGHGIKKGAKKAGNKTAQVASKGKSKIVDQPYKGKQGPNGETIYIDNKSRYYWVDKKGHKQYLSEAEL